MNRRDFLWQSGGGLGGIALASLLGADGLLAADATGGVSASATRRRPASRAEGQAGGAALHGRRRPATSICSTIKPELVKRHGKPSDFGEHVEAFQNGLGPVAQAGLGVQALRPVRQDARRRRRAARRRRRRHRLHPQHGRQDRRAQPGHAAADDRLQPPRLPGMGCWVSYGLGQPERQPADVRRAARPSRAGLERHQELGLGVPARRSTRGP